jgi:hypothetical protein
LWRPHANVDRLRPQHESGSASADVPHAIANDDKDEAIVSPPRQAS